MRLLLCDYSLSLALFVAVFLLLEYIYIVSCPAYFSHAEGKNSLVNGLFCFCSVRFKTW